MFGKKMEDVRVLVEGECIVISQENLLDEPVKVFVHSDQIPILIRWMEEAKKELEKNSPNSEE